MKLKGQDVGPSSWFLPPGAEDEITVDVKTRMRTGCPGTLWALMGMVVCCCTLTPPRQDRARLHKEFATALQQLEGASIADLNRLADMPQTCRGPRYVEVAGCEEYVVRVCRYAAVLDSRSSVLAASSKASKLQELVAAIARLYLRYPSGAWMKAN